MKIAIAASLVGSAAAAKEYVVSPVKNDYDNSMEYCLKNGMSPGSIHSKADQAAALAAMKLANVDRAYAGAEETFTNGVYKWNDGSEWDYFHDNGDGLNYEGESKLVITTWGGTGTGFWHDWGNGDSVMAVICSKDKMEPSNADYVVVKVEQSFNDGIDSCIALGRETASVHSWADNHAVKMEMKAKGTDLAFLGADEIFGQNGQYIWLDGSKWDYMSTWNDQLNQKDENKVVISLTGGSGLGTRGWHDVKWLDNKASMVCGAKNPALLNQKPMTKTFVASATARTYKGGQEWCAKQGMKMASIHSHRENNAAKAAILAAEGTWAHFKYLAYLGAEETSTEAVYTWNDGSAWDYTPTHHDGLHGVSESKIALWVGRGWNDWLNGDYEMGVVCQSNVCEAKNCEHWTCTDWCTCYDTKDESLYALNSGCTDDGVECEC